MTMNIYFEKQYSLRFSDYDRYDRLDASSVLDLFQDAAARHGESLGIGYQNMLDKGLLWVALRVKYKKLKRVGPYAEVSVKTNPIPSSRVAFFRDYRIIDESGDVAFIGSSQWALISSETRRLMLMTGVMPALDYEGVEPLYSEKFSRISDFENGGEPYRVIPTVSMLDHNGHVNNTEYLRFVYDALRLSLDDEIKEFQIDYLSEIKLGEEISVYFKREQGNALVKAVDSADKTKFLCELIF